jgi:hypothetical protein
MFKAMSVLILLTGCAWQGGDVDESPCGKALTVCLSECPVDVGSPTAARSICVDDCNADQAACEAPPTPAVHIPVCIVVAGGTYECDGVPFEHGHW